VRRYLTRRLTICDGSLCPKTDTSDPRLRLEGLVHVTREKLSVSEWAAAEDAKGHTCRCGCGKPIRIRPHHRRKGVPLYLQGHHPMATTREVGRLREQDLLTSGAVARMLGVNLKTLLGLEGRLFDPVPREGKRRLRVFTPEQVETLRSTLRETTGLGPQPVLVYLKEVARLAGCNDRTLCRYVGKDLPAGRRVVHPRRGLAFTPEEAKEIVVWVKRRRRGKQGRPPGKL